jgi:hypothetical protein
MHIFIAYLLEAQTAVILKRHRIIQYLVTALDVILIYTDTGQVSPCFILTFNKLPFDTTYIYIYTFVGYKALLSMFTKSLLRQVFQFGDLVKLLAPWKSIFNAFILSIARLFACLFVYSRLGNFSTIRNLPPLPVQGCKSRPVLSTYGF